MKGAFLSVSENRRNGRLARLQRPPRDGPESALLRSFRCEPATATHAAYDSHAPFRRPELIEENERPDNLAVGRAC